ncbi:DNA ligase, variant 3 [Coprinopsis cinerea AmutBmut pab1-1]|nr:DNA ligase, variant 3 [Coprinopsis cinerea AmutBmut pab1-1]
MAKRATAGDHSTPKKKSKVDGSKQMRLDDFLSPTKAPSGSASNTSHTRTTRSPIKTPEIINVDMFEDRPLKTSTKSTTLSALPAHPAETKSPSGSPAKVFQLRDSRPTVVDYAPLDNNPLLYSPDDQPWTSADVPYSFLCHALATLSQTRSRIAIINTLVNTLVTVIARHPPSLLPALYLLSNSLSPPYAALELGIGSSVLSKAIQHVSGLSAPALKRLYNTTGDVGDVAFAAKSKVRTLVPHAPLTVKGVYESLLKIARCKGQGAAQQKGKIVEQLLVAGNGEEIRYLVRTLAQNLRVGAVRTSILTALARAFALHPPQQSSSSTSLFHVSKSLRERAARVSGKKSSSEVSNQEEVKEIFSRAETLVKEVYVQRPCYDDIASALLQHGLPQLAQSVPLTVGIPLHPALGSPNRSFDEIYDRLGGAPFTAEFKYDGQRAQIHARRDEEGKTHVKLFSRHLEDMTTKYPDVVATIERMLLDAPATTSFILDSEIVAIDLTTGELKSFQELSNRPRKGAKLENIKVAVGVFAFDLMYYNQQSLLLAPFRERRALLRSKFSPFNPDDKTLARFDFVDSCESTAGKAAVTEFWEKAVSSRCEGLMIKVLDSMGDNDSSPPASRISRKSQLPATYEPDKRTSAWLKLKKDYIEGMGDSLDMVPIGAWYGNGRKAGWWSPILLGLWDPSAGRVIAMCKCMSGFTDAFYKNLSESYSLNSDDCSDQSRWDCELGGFRPDVYFKPKEVWEIRGAECVETASSI